MTDRTDDEITADLGVWQARVPAAEPSGDQFAALHRLLADVPPLLARAQKAERARDRLAGALDLATDDLVREVEQREKAEAGRDVWRKQAESEDRISDRLGRMVESAEAERDALAARLQAVRRLCDLIGDGSDEGLPTAYALACLIRGQINPDRALAVPLDTPEGETAARGENVYFDPSLASDSTILEAARPYCKHGVLPADACALCSPVGSPEGETAKPKCPRCKDSGLLWDITTTNGGGGSLSRPCPCGCNPLVLRNSPVGSSGGEQK